MDLSAKEIVSMLAPQSSAASYSSWPSVRRQFLSAKSSLILDVSAFTLPESSPSSDLGDSFSFLVALCSSRQSGSSCFFDFASVTLE